MSKEKKLQYQQKVHIHDHRTTPHLHTFSCERFTSGYDTNRQHRFYFTTGLTPVRVYLSYEDTKLNEKAKNEMSKREKVKNTSLNGRKLSPRTLKRNFRLSANLVEDAKNLIFMEETRSFIPQISLI